MRQRDDIKRATKAMSAGPDSDVSQAFWEERGKADMSTGPEVTMFGEHERYLAYVHERELSYLQRWIAPNASTRVLDIGCGTGRLAVDLANQAGDVLGVDIAESLLFRARATASARGLENVSFRQWTSDQPLEGGPFDAVLISGVLNCVTPEIAGDIVHAAAGVLKPGGLLYLRNRCANAEAFTREVGPRQPPVVYRTGPEYVRLVEAVPALTILEERYLFPPVCVPKILYYDVIPQQVRDLAPVRAGLDLWFRAESVTAESRVAWMTPLHTRLVHRLGISASFRVMVARRG